MPGIPTYERRVGTPQGLIGVTRVDTSAAGQGLQALGQGISNAGGSLGQVAQINQQKTEDQAALAASNSLSEGEKYWIQRTNELSNEYVVGGDDQRKKFDTEFKDWRNKQRQALPTEKARVWFDQHANSMDTRYSTQIYGAQEKAITEKVVSDTKLGMDSDYAVISADPTRFDEVTQRRTTANAAQSRIPEGKRAEINAAYLQEAALHAEAGQMRRDPAAYLRTRVAPQAARVEAGGPAPEAGGLPEDLWTAQKNQESGGQMFSRDGTVKTSAAGAIGIAQVMPGTGPEAARLAGLPWDDARFRSDSAYNEALGKAYMAQQMKTFDGDVRKALAAYNMGPGSAEKGNGVAGLVAKYGEDWMAHAPAETQNYVASILAKSGGTAAMAAAGGRPSLTAAGVEFAADAPKTFGLLDQGKQYQLVDEAERLIRQGAAVRSSEADRLMTDALAMHKDGKVDPFNLTPDYFTMSYGPVEGPIKAAAYQGGRAMAVDIQNFSTQTDGQIKATLDASKPVEGPGYAAGDARQGIRVQAALQVVKQRQEDPLQFAMKNGLTAAAPIDMAKPDTIGPELNKRIGTARMMNEQYGTPYRVLSNSEAAQMSQALNVMPTQQKLSYLDQVRTGLGQDVRAYNSVLAQIAPDSPVTAVAGSILIKETPAVIPGWTHGGDVVLQPRNVAALMLEGESILNPTKSDKKQDGRGGNFPMPKEVDLQTAFNGAVGEAFRGDPAGYGAAYQAFKAYYAGSASRKGILSDAMDSKLAKEAALAATGGTNDYNGLGAVMKPWGMTDGDFKDRVAAGFDAAMIANGLKGTPFDALSSYGLQSVGEGRYLLTNGASYLNGPRGPIEINIKPSSMREKLSLTSPALVPPPDTPRRSSGVVQ